MEKVKSAEVVLVGDRGYPLEKVVLPELITGDFHALVAEAQALRPVTTVEEVLREVWAAGVKATSRKLKQNRAVRTE